ncbi:unnamed protein product [Lathyrus oleraceus]
MAPSKQITPKPKTPKKQQQLAPAKKVRAPRKQPPAMKANQQQLSPGPDIISDLSDCILIHILSFMDAQEAVQTCILSKRWINVWKKLHTLTLLDYSELSGKLFEHFVFKFLSLRDDQTDIHSILLHTPFLRKECNKLVYHILKYAFSHHVQHLLIKFICFKPNCFSFSSSTLKSLELTSDHLISGVISIFPNSLNFPALTTLSLSYFTFFSNEDGCAEPFSTFNMLNTLIIDHCQVLHKRHLCISNAKLENLSITMCYYMISRTYFEIELYAPSLRTFSFKGNHISKLFGSKSFSSSIKQLKINIRCFENIGKNYWILLNWLEQFANIESLLVDTYTLEVLFLFLDLLKVNPPSLINLKSLKIETSDVSNVCRYDEEINFLLQNSHLANVENIIVDAFDY